MFGNSPLSGYTGLDGISQAPQSGYLGLDGQQPMMQVGPAPQKHGMFGGGVSIDLGRALAGYLAGIGNPAGVQALQALNEDRRSKQELQQQAQQADLASQRELQRQKDLYQFQLDNPKPTDPHYFQDNAGNQMAIGPDGKPIEVYHDPLQVKWIPNGLGGVVPVNVSAYVNGMAAGTPAPAHVTFTPLDDPKGGQTGSPLSGPFPDIGPYHRY